MWQPFGAARGRVEGDPRERRTRRRIGLDGVQVAGGGGGGGGRKGGEKEEEVKRGRMEDAGLDVGEVRGEVGVGVAGGGRGALPSAVARSVAARSLSSTASDLRP